MSFKIFLSILIFSGVIIAAEFKIPNPTEFTIVDLKLIGDFDGDGSNDVLVHGAVDYAVYSYAKKEYLITISTFSGMSYSISDLDNDGAVEIVDTDRFKVYSYDGGTSLAKK